ncbi:MAG: hypothetical protein KA473_18195 [Anaerolineales bacterium]|nr:hypothetical protein [Anaerolineales bacterium]MBP6211364.1 hypothetical protein [Anaerolineales bacterium]MBP8165342.1 hypothetical protein [Anaerolineales bacterium]
MIKKTIILASLLGLLAACSQAADVAPTPLPPEYLPTVVALTGQAAIATTNASFTATPTEEASLPTVTPVPSTALPTITPTIEPGFTEFAQIRFLSPGPMSSVISSFNLQTLLVSGESEIVQVDLLGEDGRVLHRILERVARNPSGNYRKFDMLFEIRAVSEAGYIRISTKDEFGRIQALNTMPVLLFSVGSNQINPPGNTIYERTMLEGIKEGMDIFGGELKLKGLFWPFNEQPVFVDLVTSNGKAISSRVLNFEGIEPESFETTLPYKVTEPTRARLTFHQENPLLSISDPDLAKYIYVYSVDIILNP